MPENRNRSETLTIRVTKSEKAAIVKQAKKAKMSMTDYIVALSKQVVIYPPPDMSPLLTELKRNGNNLNQIAAKVNSGVSYVPGMQTVVENQDRICELILKMMETAPWQP